MYLIENGLIILECVALEYGNEHPEDMIHILVDLV